MNSRRTTLGPISQSNLNSRQSYVVNNGRPSLGPSRVSYAPSDSIYPIKTQQNQPRATIGVQPQNNARRSSIGNTVGNAPRLTSLCRLLSFYV